MNKMLNMVKHLLAFFLMVTMLTACGGGGSETSTGTLGVGLTDNPGDYDHVFVTIKEVQVKQGIDDEARKAARDIVSYFSGSALLHHRDEEEDLFPRLNRQSLRIAELIQDLKQEHTRLDQLWENMVTELKPLPDKHFSDGFLQATRNFCTLSRQHVNRENMEFLPLAASSLSQLDLDEIGASMAVRRGVRI